MLLAPVDGSARRLERRPLDPLGGRRRKGRRSRARRRRPLALGQIPLGLLEGRLALIPTVIAVAEAVAYAHSLDIIHRDLKPGNVMLGAYGETIVIDGGSTT